MGVLDSLALGLGVALSAQNLAYCFAGVALGTLIGVLPGIGPLTTIGLLFPITFYLPPLPSLIMLAGIYYGAQYGGAITSILVNRAGDLGARLVPRRLHRHPAARARRAAAGGMGARLRPG
jgi:TctA family transporter